MTYTVIPSVYYTKETLQQQGLLFYTFCWFVIYYIFNWYLYHFFVDPVKKGFIQRIIVMVLNSVWQTEYKNNNNCIEHVPGCDTNIREMREMSNYQKLIVPHICNTKITNYLCQLSHKIYFSPEAGVVAVIVW